MKTTFGALAVAVALTQPASAVTFPSLTTIYVGAGVSDDGAIINNGVATVFNCSNVSGVAASVRFLVLNSSGGSQGSVTTALQHGATHTVATHLTNTFTENTDLSTGSVGQGVMNIESTQSGVFCHAMIVDAADAGNGIVLPLVRVNPHPGTVE